MQIRWNGEIQDVEAVSLHQLVPSQDSVVVIYNGYQTTEDLPLEPNAEVVVIPKGVYPKREQLEAMLTARHTPQVHAKVKRGAVAIAGLGGLGSHIAVMLARLGVGRLLLVDYDIVEPSNLNRQQYTLRHLGMYKTEAMRQQIAEINPFVEVELCTQKVTAENAAIIFKGWSFICEAFDAPENKAMLLQALLPDPSKVIVAASGMAGYASSNTIQTKQRMGRLYVCGDEISEAKPGWGLMAPRVEICAGHQANMILRLLLGITEVEDKS